VLVLFDADWAVYRVGFASEDVSESYARSRLVELFTDIVYIDCKADDYKAYISGKGNYREQVAVTVPYKGNRVDMKKPKHYEYLRGVLKDRLFATVCNGYEADDAVAIQSTLHPEAIIVHVDKDLDQLPGKHYNPVKREFYEITQEEGMRNFYKQMLTGDRVDNIKGVGGIGPAKADKALKSAHSEVEMASVVWDIYKDKKLNQERFIENGRLLWLQREPGQLWTPPMELT
jgi:5'-3' exonuclease